MSAEGTSTFHFESFRLESLALSRTSPADPEGSLTYDVSFSQKHEGVAERERALRAILTLHLVWACEPPFDLEAVASGVFRWDEQCPQELVQRLLRAQVPALIYTQLRPIVRLLVAEAGFAGFILPTYNFMAHPIEFMAHPIEL